MTARVAGPLLGLGLLLGAIGRADAQFVSPLGFNPIPGLYAGGAVPGVTPGLNFPTGGYLAGISGFNVFGGYPAYGYGGTTAYDQYMLRQQQFALNNARYDLAQSRMMENSQRALLLNQKAKSQALDNEQKLYEMQRTFNLDAQKQAAANQPTVQDIQRVIDSDGNVRWPRVTPNDSNFQEGRQEVEQAVQDVYQQYTQSGEATVQSVLDLKDVLYPFGRTALNRVKAVHNDQTAREFLNFLQTLDGVTSFMANPSGGQQAQGGS